MKFVEKNHPRHERPSRRGTARRINDENKEQEILKEEKTRRNRDDRPFGRMERRGLGCRHHNCMESNQPSYRRFGWRTEERSYWTEETAPESGEFRQRANRPMHKRQHWSARPRSAQEQTPERRRRQRWAMRPRHADEHRREGGEFHARRLRDDAHQAQPDQQRHPSQILREKWMLEEKLFRISRRIQRLNRQLRG